MASKSKVGGVNSRRRGVPSSEPDRIVRREFVREMQAIASAGILERPIESVSVEELLKATKVVDKRMDFSAALAMAEASLAAEPEPEEIAPDEVRVYSPGEFVPERWMIDLNTVPYPTSRLILFHGVGQSHMFFRPWADRFRLVNVALHAICLPGRCHRINEPFCGVADAARLVVRTIELYHDNQTESRDANATKWTKIPTYIYGHCLGALIGFEVAKTFNMQFHDKNHANKDFRIAHLVVSGATPPHVLTVTNKDRYQKKWTMQTDADLMNRAASLGGVPQVLRNKHRRDLLRLFVPAVREDYYAYEKYEYVPMARKSTEDRGSVDCPITTFGTRDDKFLDYETATEWELVTDYGAHSVVPGAKGGAAPAAAAAASSSSSDNSPQINLKFFFLVGGHSWLNIPYKQDVFLHFLLQVCTAVEISHVVVRMPTWEDEEGDDEYVREVEEFYGR